jgi:hypothetical protein
VGQRREGGDEREGRRRGRETRGDDGDEHHGTHPHAYELLLVGWIVGATGSTHRHADEQLLVGWMVCAPGLYNDDDDVSTPQAPTTTPNGPTSGPTTTTTTIKARRRRRAPQHPPPRLRATARRVDDGCGLLRRAGRPPPNDTAPTPRLRASARRVDCGGHGRQQGDAGEVGRKVFFILFYFFLL